MQATVIGIDFSTDPAKTGLARATVSASDGQAGAIIHEVCTATKIRRPRLRIVADWIKAATTPVLIAVDAPLGWPDAMRSSAFSDHVAGHPVGVCANDLFARETDRQIKARTSKNPFEVGANLIARTAHGALTFLHHLNTELNGSGATRATPPPLAWSSAHIQRPSVIEVYPAATLEAHRIPTGNYKTSGDGGRSHREAIVRKLRLRGVEDHTSLLTRNDHLIDAAVCVLAGQDFLVDRAVGPGSLLTLAQREGWIWAARVTPAPSVGPIVSDAST